MDIVLFFILVRGSHIPIYFFQNHLRISQNAIQRRHLLMRVVGLDRILVHILRLLLLELQDLRNVLQHYCTFQFIIIIYHTIGVLCNQFLYFYFKCFDGVIDFSVYRLLKLKRSWLLHIRLVGFWYRNVAYSISSLHQIQQREHYIIFLLSILYALKCLCEHFCLHYICVLRGLTFQCFFGNS